MTNNIQKCLAYLNFHDMTNNVQSA